MRKFVVFFVVLFCFSLFSCSNLFDGISSNANRGEVNSTDITTITVSFGVAGSVPEQLISSQSSDARTAGVSLTGIISSYKIIAIDNNDETITRSSASIDTATATSGNINLIPGTWKIKVAAYDSSSKEILSGFWMDGTDYKTITLPYTETLPSISIVLKPNASNGTGKVNLPINLNGAGVKSVKAEWESYSQKVTSNVDLTSFILTLNQGEITDGSTPALTPVAAGSYDVKISFYKNNDYSGPLFVCHEKINVFANLETNFWQNSTQCGYVGSNGSFTLTSAILTGRTEYYVKSNGDSTNEGSNVEPLDSVQTAVDRIIAKNNGSDYTIYLLSDYVSAGNEDFTGREKSVVNINNTSDDTLNLRICSFGDIYKIDANRKEETDSNKFANCIYVSSSDKKVYLSLDKIKLTGGKSSTFGGAMCVDGNVSVTLDADTEIYGNFALAGGGIAIGKFNTSGYTPPGMLIYNGVKIYNNVVTATADSDCYGAGVYLEAGSVTMNGGIIGSDSLEQGNKAIHLSESSPSKGGGVYIIDNTSFTMNGGEILNNSADEGECVTLFGGNFYFFGGNIATEKNNAYVCAINVFHGNGSISPAQFYMKDNAHFENNNIVLLKPYTYRENEIPSCISLNYSLNQQTINGENVPSARLKIDTNSPYNKIVLQGGNTSSEYSKFEYAEDGYTISSQGKVTGNLAKNITNPTTCSGIYLITDKEDLLTLTQNATNWRGATYQNCTFKLTNDIDLETELFRSISYLRGFSGIFDGNGFTIKNFNINYIQDPDFYQGFDNYFGFVACLSGVIKNLTIEGEINLGGMNGRIGTFCGGQSTLASGGRIENCISKVNITCAGSCGGFTGNGPETIVNCVNFGTINGNVAGGIVGGSIKGNTIINCVNFGEITGTANAGGIVGSVGTGKTINIENCYNFAKIKSDTNAGLISGSTSGTVTATNVYNVSITGETTAASPGGSLSCNSVTNTASGITTFTNTLKSQDDSWSGTLAFSDDSNAIKYPIPISCNIIVSMVGNKRYPDKVGDIVYNDGSCSEYSSSLTLTDTQKAAAMGVVFTTTYNPSNGSNTDGNKILMVGKDKEAKSFFNFTDSEDTFWDDENDGYSNWDDTKNGIPGGSFSVFPPYSWLDSTMNVYTGVYNTEWYIPSKNEAVALGEVVDTINPVLEKISTDSKITSPEGVANVFWSSTINTSNHTQMWAYKYANNPDIGTYSSSTTYLVLIIHKIN